MGEEMGLLTVVKNKSWTDLELEKDDIIKTVVPRASVRIIPVDEVSQISPLGFQSRISSMNFYAPQDSDSKITYPITASEKETPFDEPTRRRLPPKPRSDFDTLRAQLRGVPRTAPVPRAPPEPKPLGSEGRLPVDPKSLRMVNIFNPQNPKFRLQIDTLAYNKLAEAIDRAIKTAGTEEQIKEAFGPQYVEAITQALNFASIGGKKFPLTELKEYLQSWGFDYDSYIAFLGELQKGTVSRLRTPKPEVEPLVESEVGQVLETAPASYEKVNQQFSDISGRLNTIVEYMTQVTSKPRARWKQELIDQLETVAAEQMVFINTRFENISREFDKIEAGEGKDKLLKKLEQVRENIEDVTAAYDTVMTRWEGGEGGSVGPSAAR